MAECEPILKQDESLIELREVLENMSPLELRTHKVKMLREMSDREAVVHAINEVLDGYGTI